MADTKEALKATVREFTFTKRVLLDVYTYFGLFDGYRKVVGEEPILQPYDLGGGVRWNIALVRSTIKPFVEKITDARNEFLKQLLPKDSKELPRTILNEEKQRVPNPVYLEFEEGYGKILDETITVKLHTFLKSDWKIERNPFPPTMIEYLMLLTEKEAENEEVTDNDSDSKG